MVGKTMQFVVFLLILNHQTESTSIISLKQKPERAHRSPHGPCCHAVPIHLHPFNLYFAKICLGTPAEEFLFFMDTGSIGVWVASKKSSQTDSVFNKKYDSAKSVTHLALSSGFSLEYEGFEVSGILSKDLFKIGDMNLTNFVFGEAIQYSGFTDGMEFHGVLGLDPKSGNPAFDQTFVDFLLREQLINREIFTIHYIRTPEQDGEIVFGCSPEDYFGCKITYLNLTDPFSWSVSIPRILLENEILCENCLVTIDSGHSLNNVPEPIARLINSQFQLETEENGYFYLPCSQKRKTRPITLVFAEDATVTLDDYFLENPQDSTCFSAFKFIQDMDEWIFGVDILQKLFTVFDTSKQRIGFAKSQC